MAYTPTVWAKGDVITAVKLNKAENGIASASVLYVTVTKEDDAYVADADFDDVCTAIDDGQDVKLIYVQEAVGPLPEIRHVYDLKQYAIASEAIVYICFMSANVSGGGELTVIGLQWTTEGISNWPAES